MVSAHSRVWTTNILYYIKTSCCIYLFSANYNPLGDIICAIAKNVNIYAKVTVMAAVAAVQDKELQYVI